MTFKAFHGEDRSQLSKPISLCFLEGPEAGTGKWRGKNPKNCRDEDATTSLSFFCGFALKTFLLVLAPLQKPRRRRRRKNQKWVFDMQFRDDIVQESVLVERFLVKWFWYSENTFCIVCCWWERRRLVNEFVDSKKYGQIEIVREREKTLDSEILCVYLFSFDIFYLFSKTFFFGINHEPRKEL